MTRRKAIVATLAVLFAFLLIGVQWALSSTSNLRSDTAALSPAGTLTSAASYEEPLAGGSSGGSSGGAPAGGVTTLTSLDLQQAPTDRHAYQTEEAQESDTPDSTTSSYAAGSVVISVPSDATQEGIEAAFADLGIQSVSLSLVSGAADDSTLTLLACYDSDADPAQVAQSLATSGAIAYAEPDYMMTLCDVAGETLDSDVIEGTTDGAAADATADLETTKINDPLAAQYQWGLTSIDAYDAWDIAKTKGAVTVAVVDSGVDADHSDLVDNLVLGNYAKNTYTEATGAAAVNDEIGHGTHVAGIIAAEANNSIGVAGVSYNAKVLPIKATCDSKGNLYSSDLIEAVDYIVGLKTSAATTDLANIRVINMSLGGPSSSELYQKAIDDANDAGILVVAAAGNESTSKATYPAAYDGVVGVSALKSAASGPGEFDSSYSNYGSYVDVAAPGSVIASTYLQGQYCNMSGTSMASPMVAGCAAVLYSMDMDATPTTIAKVLMQTAVDLGTTGRDDYYGYGAVDLQAAAELMADASKVDIALATVAAVPSQHVTGAAITPGVTVTYLGKTLVEGTDYELSYSSNVDPGTATITITGEGTYKGTQTVKFAIEGHQSVTDAAVEPTCIAAGLTEGSHCSVCGQVIVAQQEVPALGHDWGEWVVTKEATCAEAGIETRTCSRDASHVETREIAALDHQPVTDAAVEPTCTAAGLTEGSHCSVCGQVIVAQQEVPALGHDWGDWVVTKPATTTEEGVKTRVCARDASHVETQSIPIVEPSISFPDVQDATAWYYNSVYRAAKADLISGYDNGTFGPNDTLTRAQAATILWRYYDPTAANAYDSVKSVTKNGTGMSDVADYEWYTGAANWAVAQGVISGKDQPNGSKLFDPNGTITREQLCAIIANASAKFAGANVAGSDRTKFNSMPDSGTTDQWAIDSVAWGLNHGVISGKSNTYIAPLDSVTRAEMAAVLMNSIDAGLLGD